MTVSGESASAAARALLEGRSSARVLAAMSPQQPDLLLRAVVAGARELGVELTLLVADLTGKLSFLDRSAEDDLASGRLRIITLAGPVPRRLSPVLDYLPYSLWEIDRMLATGEVPVDILLASVSTASDPSLVSYGRMVGYTCAARRQQPRLGLEVAPFDPFAPTSDTFDRREADVWIEVPPPPSPTAVEVSFDPVQQAIARHVAGLIPDRATIEFGIGKVADAAVNSLDRHRDLGIHSGLLTPSMQRLIDTGAATGLAKGIDVGLHVATGVWSSAGEQPHQWPAAAVLRPITNTHAQSTLNQLERFWAVNSAFQVDLAGQVNAEYAGGIRIASGGGQTDFVRAGHSSPGGASVIALPSRSPKGTSSIVAALADPHRVTSAGADIDHVITEHGVAALRGRTAHERASALIAIAHPADRDALTRALAEHG